MKKLYLFIISLFLLNIIRVSAQENKDTILLLNGVEITTTVYDTLFGLVRFKDPKPDKDPVEMESSDIFSIRNSKGEFIKYVYDSAGDNNLTIDEMRYYIKGEQDAQKGFKPHGAFWTNVLIGAASGATGVFYCPIPPFLFTALCGATKVKIKHSTVSNLEYLKHDTYVMGYEHVARGKRKLKSLLGGGYGLVGGIGAAIILKNTGNALLK